jgi:VIT1/CCC1 family predicted Fe2+/Mn2+ transporter
VIVLGVILLILAAVLHVSILWTVGIILIVVGAILWILGSTGHALAGRRHWY